MTARRLAVHLRYRPASDILTGTVELTGLPILETFETTLDADSTVFWARLVHPDASGPTVHETSDASETGETGDTFEVLSSFHVIHARALAQTGSLPGLPTDMEPHVRAVLQAGVAALRDGASTLERVQARADVTLTMSLLQLRRPDEGAIYAPPQWSSDSAERRRASASLRRLSSALSSALSPVAPASGALTPSLSWRAEAGSARSPSTVPRSTSPIADRNERVARLVDELASVLDTSDGLAAAGTSAAAALAADRDLSLPRDDRDALGRALRNMASPSAWRQASRDIDRVAELLKFDAP